MIRELRAEISVLRDNLTKEASPGGSVPATTKEVSRLETMIADLQVAKQQTWAEKERLSEMYEEERRKNMASKVRLILWNRPIYWGEKQQLRDLRAGCFISRMAPPYDTCNNSLPTP